MILVDTCIWIDHLRHGDQRLSQLFAETRVCIHPAILGELALGSLRDRATVLSLLNDLPQTMITSPPELLYLVDSHRLFGCGLSLVDAHLLASTLITTGTRLWTRDRRLHEVAVQLKIAA